MDSGIVINKNLLQKLKNIILKRVLLILPTRSDPGYTTFTTVHINKNNGSINVNLLKIIKDTEVM